MGGAIAGRIGSAVVTIANSPVVKELAAHAATELATHVVHAGTEVLGQKLVNRIRGDRSDDAPVSEKAPLHPETSRSRLFRSLSSRSPSSGPYVASRRTPPGGVRNPVPPRSAILDDSIAPRPYETEPDAEPPRASLPEI